MDNYVEDQGNGVLWNETQNEGDEVLERSIQPGISQIFRKNQYGQAEELTAAVMCNDFKRVKELIDAGANPNAEESDGLTAIMTYALFCSYGERNPDILRLLLKSGANPTKILNSGGERKGTMQMDKVFMWGDRKTIRVFLEANIDFTTKDSHGRTAFHSMAENTKADVFNELKDVKCDVNARDNYNSTPLHHIQPISLGAVKFFLGRGADVNAKNDEGMTALIKVWQDPDCRNFEEYYTEKSKQVIEYLLSQGADLETVVLGRCVTIFSDLGNKIQLYWIESVLAHLALNEARGMPISELIINNIKGNISLSKHFDKCKSELEKMNAVRVFNSVSLFKLLIAKQSELERYVCNQQLVSNLRRLKNKNLHTPYYRYILRSRVVKAIKMVCMKNIVIVYLSGVTGIPQSSYSIIFDQIVDYLSETDLINMCTP